MSKEVNEVIVYGSQYDKEIQELSYELAGDIGAWLWIWVPIILKWYLLIAVIVFVFYEVITGIRGKFNGIGDGLAIGLAWPHFLLKAIKPAFNFVFYGNTGKTRRY